MTFWIASETHWVHPFGRDPFGRDLDLSRVDHYTAGVARAHSFKITLSNNKTEKEGLDYLLASEPEWFLPTSKGRKDILRTFGLDPKYARAFDLVWVKGKRRHDGEEWVVASTDELVFIELKTTKKRLPNNPFGFFFGATKNELDFGAALGEKFALCFVCLHPNSRSHKLLSLSELAPLIRTKRIQYQINLIEAPAVDEELLEAKKAPIRLKPMGT